MIDRLNGVEWALVTGASSGIGRAFALQLADLGYSVLLVARRRDELQRLAAEVEQRNGRAKVLAADLSTPEGLQQVSAEAERLGLAVLVNNAGLGVHGRFIEQSLDGQMAQVAVNVGAVVGLTRSVLPHMVAKGRGQIINLASVLSFMPVPYFATYAATKAFVLSFTEALSHELRGTGVRVLATCPGPVKTEFAQLAGSAENEKYLPHVTPEFVARASIGAARARRVIRVMGPFFKLLAFLPHITPRAMFRAIMGNVFAPRSTKAIPAPKAVEAPARASSHDR
jgi:short-subunit dehydrogenase